MWVSNIYCLHKNSCQEDTIHKHPWPWPTFTISFYIPFQLFLLLDERINLLLSNTNLGPDASTECICVLVDTSCKWTIINSVKPQYLLRKSLTQFVLFQAVLLLSHICVKILSYGSKHLSPNISICCVIAHITKATFSTMALKYELYSCQYSRGIPEWVDTQYSQDHTAVMLTKYKKFKLYYVASHINWYSVICIHLAYLWQLYTFTYTSLHFWH